MRRVVQFASAKKLIAWLKPIKRLPTIDINWQTERAKPAKHRINQDICRPMGTPHDRLISNL